MGEARAGAHVAVATGAQGPPRARRRGAARPPARSGCRARRTARCLPCVTRTTGHVKSTAIIMQGKSMLGESKLGEQHTMG
eukprot:7380109-Prymnesium_polylepis.1